MTKELTDEELMRAYVDEVRRRDPRLYLNMQAARNNLLPGDIPEPPLTDEVLTDVAEMVAGREHK